MNTTTELNKALSLEDTTRQGLKDLAQSLLDDDMGINEEAYNNLYVLLKAYNIQGITERVDATEGRFYLIAK